MGSLLFMVLAVAVVVSVYLDLRVKARYKKVKKRNQELKDVLKDDDQIKWCKKESKQEVER